MEGDNIVGEETYLTEVRDDFLEFHEKLVAFSLFLQEQSVKKEPEKTRNHLAVSALTRMQCDLVCIHRAILTLCEGGWAFIASNLIRTMLDIIISAGAIVNHDEPTYMAFKYFTLSFKQRLSEKDTSGDEREGIKKQINLSLDQLHGEVRKKAKEWFYRAKLLTYWYSPEFSRPRDIITAYSSPEVQFLYDKHSGSVHGGFLGMNLLRDEPDKMTIEPRVDRQAPVLALSSSYRIMLEFARLRNTFENLKRDREILKLQEEFDAFREYVKSVKPLRES